MNIPPEVMMTQFKDFRNEFRPVARISNSNSLTSHPTKCICIIEQSNCCKVPGGDNPVKSDAIDHVLSVGLYISVVPRVLFIPDMIRAVSSYLVIRPRVCNVNVLSTLS